VPSNSIIAALTADALAFIEDHSVRRRLTLGEVIYEEGAPVTHAVFPESGVVAMMAEMSDGRSVHQNAIGREGFVGFTTVLGGGTALGRSVVLVAGEALSVGIRDIDAAFERFACVRAAMLRYGQANTKQLMQMVACNSLHTADQRLARWLLQTHDRMGEGPFYMTQDAMAKALALRRATVNMVCSDLMAAGAIDYHRGTISVTDRAGLEGRACECYGRIRRAFETRG
jgi:CRP-like cAMP-binding protein